MVSVNVGLRGDVQGKRKATMDLRSKLSLPIQWRNEESTCEH